MLVIRDAQLGAFDDLARRDMEARLLAHVEDAFADQCGILGADATCEVVHHGIARAAAHGFVDEDQVAAWLQLMFALGRDFDLDPRFPWARAVLADPASLHPAARLRRLHLLTMEHLRAETLAGGAPG